MDKTLWEKDIQKLKILELMIKKYDKNKKDLPIPLNQIKTIKEFEKLLDFKRHLERLKTYYTSNEVKVWYDSLEWIVFQAFTYEVSQFANSRERDKDPIGANWCTTYDESHFKNYYGEKGAILYCVNKLDYKEDIAFQLKPNDIDIHVWDWKDNNLHDCTKYTMKDEFDENTEIYKVFEEKIEDEIEDIEIDYDTLVKKVREWYFNLGPYEVLYINDLIDYLNRTDFVDKYINQEKEYYINDAFIDFCMSWTNQVIDYLLQDYKVELFELFDVDDVGDLNVAIEQDVKKLSNFAEEKNLEKEIVDNVLSNHYQGYDVVDITSEIYGNVENMDVSEFEDYFGGYFDLDEIFDKYVNSIIDNSSEEELLEIIGD